MSHPFLDASIPDIVRKLRLDEKISLLSGADWWNTTPIERLAIPSIRMSDGPNGVRGSSHFVSVPAQCLPCATSLASTFDIDLIKDVGTFLAHEAKVKSSVVLLAPTCNIQRNPLGGRSFESFSEDPYLSGMLASAYVHGLQSQGVAATIKHLVGNDQEDQRAAADSVMSDRALREIYLYPFMLAQKHAQPWAYMTSYGRVKGTHCSENRALLQGILRNEWKFRGIVVSDWSGTYSVHESLIAGLDLEMPGLPRWRTHDLVHHCLVSQKLQVSDINDRVANLLTFIQLQARRNPNVVFGDGLERSRDSTESRKFCRRIAAEGIILLKNERDILPVSNPIPSKPKKLLLVGPHVMDGVISGGGSAALKPTYVVSPWQGITLATPEDIIIDYALGCYAYRYLPTLEKNLRTPDGAPGWLCTFYNHDSHGELAEPVAKFILNDTRIKLNDFLPPGLTKTWSIKLTGLLEVPYSGPFELGLTVAGRAKLWIDGVLTIDNWTKQTPGEFFYGQGTVEEKTVVELMAGQAVDVLVEYTNTSPQDAADGDPQNPSSQPALMRGVRLGGCEKIDPDNALKSAVEAAANADTVVYLGGLTPEWESEGFDRPILQMPGRQDELITKLAEANSNTVVCIQAGSAVSMPWVDKVRALLQVWYLGNETGNAIADVLFGKVNPGGKLPLTLPHRVEDVPSFLNMHSENGKIYYQEDLYVGYKWYQARRIKPLFPFGFGLSYTRFALSQLTWTAPSSHDDSFTIELAVTVTNEGPLAGSEVVQVYVSYPEIMATSPKLQLKGFAKARDLAAGCSQRLSLKLDKYAISFWETKHNKWCAAAGEYGLFVGTSCEDISLKGHFKLEHTFFWSGL